jgi:competence protein ComEC
MEGLVRWLQGRRAFAQRGGWRAVGQRVVIPAAVALAVLLLAAWPSGSKPPPVRSGLLVRVLDVGQGDSILLETPGSDPVLIDTGPPGDGVEDRLRELDVERLAAIVITHHQSDHAGGLAGLLESMTVDRLVFAAEAAQLGGAALTAGAEPLRLAEGSGLDFGALRLTALWPPRELLAAAGADPNRLSLVLVARWRHFSMLLTGDAEAESVPMDPGAIDVLKVSHHGSEDAGLEGLLERSVPKLAVISVGDDNPYGHPTEETLSELRSHRVATMRTDRQGEIEIRASGSGWTARPAGD